MNAKIKLAEESIVNQGTFVDEKLQTQLVEVNANYSHLKKQEEDLKDEMRLLMSLAQNKKSMKR